MDPLTWILIGSFLAGAGVGYFWDEIIAWAERAVKAILNAINYAIEVTSRAVLYLVRQGKRYYKTVEVYVRNIYSKSTRLDSRQEEVAETNIPQDILADLEYKQKIKVGEQNT